MQALSSHYEIYKRVCFYTRLWPTRLWSQSSFLLSAPGGGDDDLLRRGVQNHITDNQLAFGRHVLERHRHHIGCAIGAGRQRVSYLSGSPLRRGKRRSAACGPMGGRFFWSGRRGSNSLPGIPRMAVAIRRSPASPLDLTRFAQVEAASSPVLRHIPKRIPHPVGWGILFGAGDEARTRYLDLGKVALYQMSYARKRKVDYSV